MTFEEESFEDSLEEIPVLVTTLSIGALSEKQKKTLKNIVENILTQPDEEDDDETILIDRLERIIVNELLEKNEISFKDIELDLSQTDLTFSLKPRESLRTLRVAWNNVVKMVKESVG